MDEYIEEEQLVRIDDLLGIDLDKAIAERVFVLVRCTNECHDDELFPHPCYASPESPNCGRELEIYHGEALDRVKERLAYLKCGWIVQYKDGVYYAAVGSGEGVGGTTGQTEGETLCRAALKAITGGEELIGMYDEQTNPMNGVKSNRAPGTGIMWEFDHARALGWKEYQHWMLNPLPFGWSIISAPEEGAEVIRSHS